MCVFDLCRRSELVELRKIYRRRVQLACTIDHEAIDDQESRKATEENKKGRGEKKKEKEEGGKRSVCIDRRESSSIDPRTD